MRLAIQTDRTATPPRAEGAARIAVAVSGGRTRIAGFRQQGSLKVLWPRGGPGPLQAVLLNTAGGLTGGDRMTFAAEAGPGAALELTTQAAERAYRALPGTRAEVTVRLSAGPGARIDWLPQETILYDGAALARHLTVDLTGDATALIVEPLVIGRRAMGERVRTLSFTDRWDIRRDGRRLFADALRLTGDAEAALDRTAIGGGARAAASVLFAGPQAAGLIPGLRARLPAPSAASLIRDGLLFARLLAPDGHALRAVLIPALTNLSGRPLPKVWRL